MFPVLLICLTISTAAANPQIGKAPQAPEWTPGLPGAVQQDGGTFLPSPMDHEVLRRLVFLDRYQELCQSSLDALAKVNSADAAGKQTVCDAAVVQEAADDGWPTWQVVAVGVASVFVGGFVGYASGVAHGK